MSDSQTARWREGSEWYTCDMCGEHYPRRLVMVQNGRIKCIGQETRNCWDEPGAEPARRQIDINYERNPEPLPSVDEDL